jgi:hypothetical protein
MVCLGVVIAAPAAFVHAAPPGASAYVPVSPYRILDTRIGLGLPQRTSAGQNFTLTLTDVPAGSSAVVLNLTIDGPADASFEITVYPTGVDRPNASSMNADAAGVTIANLVTVPIGSGGTVDIFSQMSTDLVADVQGYYTPAASAQAGLFIPLGPTRLLDTRDPSSSHFGPLAAGEQINLAVGAIAGLPSDATAAALKVTVTNSTTSGFWTVFPTGAVPTASNLNVIGTGSTIANQGARPAPAAASPCSRKPAATSSSTSSAGSPAPVRRRATSGCSCPWPQLLLDSRQPPLGAMPGHNRTAEVPVAGRFGLPASGNQRSSSTPPPPRQRHLGSSPCGRHATTGRRPPASTQCTRPDDRRPRDHAGQHGRIRLLHAERRAPRRRHLRLVHTGTEVPAPSATARAADRPRRPSADATVRSHGW